MSATADDLEVRCWTQEEINFLSDVIATGRFVHSAGLSENALGEGLETKPESDFETTFVVSQVYKGTIPLHGKLIVRHPFGAQASASRLLVEFDSSEGDSYLVYLRSDANDRFEPTSGPTAPEMSIRRLGRPEVRNGERLPINSPLAAASTLGTAPGTEPIGILTTANSSALVSATA